MEMKMNKLTPPSSSENVSLGNSTSVKKRIHWLDVSRGLAFLMVIYSHLEYSNDAVMRYFTPVFLTSFFFVSGYLFKENCSFSKVFEQRTRTLLLPFLALGMIMILLSQVLTFNAKVPFMDAVKGLLFQNGTNQLLWFVAALYVYSVIFYWVERFSRTANTLLVLSFAMFLLNWLYGRLQMPSIPWHIDTFGYACFYMGLGKWYKEKEKSVNRYVDNKWLVLCCLVFYIILITAFDLHISFSGSTYLIDSIVVTILGLIVMLYVSKHIFDNSRFLLFVGANTLFYFAFHGKGYSSLQTLCHKFLSDAVLNNVGVHDMIAVGITLLDAVILILPAMFVNRYCRFLLGKGFKLWTQK